MTDAQSNMPAPDTTPAVPTDPAARDRELTQLYEHDPNTYFYQDGGRYATEHLAIRKAQQAAAEKADPPQSAEQTEDDGLADVDVDAIDLEADDAGDDDGTPEQPSVRPIGPPEDATEEEAAAWRAEHGVPDAPDGYDAPVVEGVEWNAEALDPIHEIAHRHNVPKQAVAEALAEYGKQLATQRAEIKRRDVANAKAVRSTLSQAEIAAVKSAAKAMPTELRKMLNTAVLPDGTKLANQVEVLRLIAARYGTDGAHQAAPQQDRRTAMQQELAELIALRDRDISEYWQLWRSTGKSGGARALEIQRELSDEAPAKPSATDLRAEERELRQLRDRDFQMFMYGDWRGSGRPAADRLVMLQTGRG